MDRHAGKGPLTVVVGAGIGGIVAARRLRERLPGDHRVLVVDRRPEIAWPPAFVRVVAGERKPQQITRQLSGLTRHGLEFRCAEAMAIDPRSRTLEIAGDRVKAEAIVLAPGARLVQDKPPGAAGVAHQFHELDAALRLRDALKSFRGGRVLVVAAGMPYRGPNALHEVALVIHRLLEHKKGTTVTLLTPEAGPMPFAGAEAATTIRALYKERGIAARFGVRPVRVRSHTSTPAGSPPNAAIEGEIELDDGSREPFDLLVMVPPHAAPAFLAKSGLLGPHGWVEVDRATLATSHDGVWALGDVAHVPLADGESLPRLGALAEAMGETVAYEVVARLLGAGERRPLAGRATYALGIGDSPLASIESDFFAGSTTIRPAERADAQRRKVAEWEWGRRY